MKTYIHLLFTVAIFGISMNASAQTKKCATMQVREQRILKDPSLNIRKHVSESKTQKWISSNNNSLKSLTIYTIPVVVHVLYNKTVENISTAQVQSQIDILNQDYRLLNADSLPNTHPFWQYTADTQIEFCLATRDTNGYATTGITRTYTDSSTFTVLGNEKHAATGGKGNWDPTKYLNIWVCNLDSVRFVLGYGEFPSDLAQFPKEDGVVICYRAFGNIGTAGGGKYWANGKGRTATHEIGHWLNLNHIWGDNFCGDDLVGDTEPAEQEHYGCPNFPNNAFNSCGAGSDGEMYMNYMDYVDDSCMNMFTYGQGLRMQAALNNERAGLLTSLACSAPISAPSQTVTPTPIPITAIQEINVLNGFNIYPNPNNGSFTINYNSITNEKISIGVFSLLGFKIQQIDNIQHFPFVMNLTELSNGGYFIRLTDGDRNQTRKIFISK